MNLENAIATLSNARDEAAHLVRTARTPAEKAKAIGLKAQATALLEAKQQEQSDAEQASLAAAWAPRDAYGREIPGAPNPFQPKRTA